MVGDLDSIVRIYRESRAEAMPWLPVLHTAEEDLRYFGDRLRSDEVYVFELDGQVAGFAVVQHDELDALYVDPGAQRRGVGSALFEHVQQARPDGFRFWAFRDNTRARPFYDARGCVVVDSSDGDNEERMPDVLYEWLPSRGEAEA